MSIRRKIIVTPNWQLWGGRNDRFAYGSAGAMQGYASRIDAVLTYCRTFQRAYHSEKMLKWYLETGFSSSGERGLLAKFWPRGLVACFTSQRAQRVRGGGNICEKDRDLNGPNFQAQVYSSSSFCFPASGKNTKQGLVSVDEFRDATQD